MLSGLHTKEINESALVKEEHNQSNRERLMGINKQYLITTVVAIFIVFSFSSVFAQENGEPNGNYTYAGVGLFKTSWTNNFCVTNGATSECYTGMSGLGLDFVYQIIPNIAISFVSSSAQVSGNIGTLKSSGGGLYIAFIAGIGPIIDVAAALGSLSSTTQLCSNSSNVCSSVSDTGSDFSLLGKLWLNENKNFNVGLGFDNYSYSKSTTKYTTAIISFSAIPADNHEFDLSLSNTNDSNGKAVSSGVSLEYKYLFDHGRPSSRRSPVETNNPAPIQNIPVQQQLPTESTKPANPANNDTAQKLRELNTLKNEGVITDSEYQSKKKQLLEKF